MLSVDVEKRLGDFAIAARFEAAGGVTALFGPSGSGKTSIVSMVAGLVTPDRGRIVCNDTVLFDSAQAVSAPPHRRGIGYVFQDGRLFPHMTVAQNLDYGRRMYRLPADAEERERVVKLLDIARLLMRPQLLLLDEPLASLDAARKREIFPYLLRLRDETAVPMIYVSHYAAEVRRIATTAVRIEDGRVSGVGGAELLDTADADAFQDLIQRR